MDKILASISGGKTSGYMAKILKESFASEIEYIFANTGFEHEETLVFLDKLDKDLGLNLVWVEAVPQRDGKGTTHKVVNFSTAARWNDGNMEGNPFVKVSDKYGVPHRGKPHCTRELKLAPIYSYINSKWKDRDYKVAIGIRHDEKKRMAKGHSNKGIFYPLIQMETDKQEVLDYWEGKSYTLNIPESHGNCLGCFKKTFSKLGDVYKSTPEAFELTRFIEKRQEAKELVLSLGDFQNFQDKTHGIQKMFGGWRNTSELISLISELDGEKIRHPLESHGGCSEECGINQEEAA